MYVTPCPECSRPIELPDGSDPPKLVCPHCRTLVRDRLAGPPVTRTAGFADTARIVGWVLVAAWAAFHTLHMAVECNRPTVSAPQQAAAAGMAAVYVVAAYVIGRAADAVLRTRSPD